MVANPQSGSSSTSPDGIAMLVFEVRGKPGVPREEGGKLIFATPWAVYVLSYNLRMVQEYFSLKSAKNGREKQHSYIKK